MNFDSHQLKHHTETEHYNTQRKWVVLVQRIQQRLSSRFWILTDSYCQYPKSGTQLISSRCSLTTHGPYFEHVRIQFLISRFFPESSMDNLHQSVDRLPQSSILVSTLAQLFLAFHKTDHPEEVLLCNEHYSFLLYVTTQLLRRPILSWPLHPELLEWQVSADAWRDVNVYRKLNPVVFVLQRECRSVGCKTARELSYNNNDSITSYSMFENSVSKN